MSSEMRLVLPSEPDGEEHKEGVEDSGVDTDMADINHNHNHNHSHNVDDEALLAQSKEDAAEDPECQQQMAESADPSGQPEQEEQCGQIVMLVRCPKKPSTMVQNHMDQVRAYWSGLKVKGADGKFPQKMYDDWVAKAAGKYCYVMVCEPIMSAKVCILSILVVTGWFYPCTPSPVSYLTSTTNSRLYILCIR